MSTESMRFGVESDKIGPCRNAEEYAIEWLEKRGGPVSPAELAEEYDCTPGHMQDALRDSEEIARVEIGAYVLATEIDTESTATVNPVESGGMALFEQGSEATDGDTDGSPRDREDQSDGAFSSDDQPDQEVEQSTGGEEIGIPLKVAVGGVAVFGVIVLASLYFNNQSDEPVREQPRQESGDSNRGILPE